LPVGELDLHEFEIAFEDFFFAIKIVECLDTVKRIIHYLTEVFVNEENFVDREVLVYHIEVDELSIRLHHFCILP
jgi:hypothetical protein